MKFGSHFHVLPPELIVIDNFYRDPDEVRMRAVAAEFQPREPAQGAYRSVKNCLLPWVRERYMQLLGCPIIDWQNHLYNGVFEWTPADTPITVRCDPEGFTAHIYLHPNPPKHSGICFYRDQAYGLRGSPTPADAAAHSCSFGDMLQKLNCGMSTEPSAWDAVAEVENVYNRLVIWNGRLFHSAAGYFGDSVETSRLYQLFSFSIQSPGQGQ